MFWHDALFLISTLRAEIKLLYQRLSPTSCMVESAGPDALAYTIQGHLSSTFLRCSSALVNSNKLI
jgi:hypothetical protein